MRVTSRASSNVERRQEGREASREHRLAGARRADEEQVVAAGGRDLERALRVLLAADLGEVDAGPSRAPGRDRVPSAAVSSAALPPLRIATASREVPTSG